MTQDIYNKLLPHKPYLASVYDCIDKGLMWDIPPSLLNIMAECYLLLGDKPPIDWNCSGCATSAMKQIVIEFINYDRR